MVIIPWSYISGGRKTVTPATCARFAANKYAGFFRNRKTLSVSCGELAPLLDLSHVMLRIDREPGRFLKLSLAI